MLRIVCFLACIILLIYGSSIKNDNIIITGSVFYLLALIIGLFEAANILRKQKNGIYKPEVKKLTTQLERILEAFLLCSSFIILMIPTLLKGLSMAAYIMWIGTVLLYFISGIVIESITKIPLEFGFGGWKQKSIEGKKGN